MEYKGRTQKQFMEGTLLTNGKYELRTDIPKDGYLSVSNYIKDTSKHKVGRYFDEAGRLISKLCKTCGKPKLITGFHRHSREVDSLRTDCIECNKARVYNFIDENPLYKTVHNHNTRNKEGGFNEKITLSELNNVYKGYRNKCTLTKNESDVSLDSFLPFSWGIPTTIDFVYPLNFNLNCRKGAKNPYTFAEEQIEKGTFSRYKWNQLVKELATRHGLKPSKLKKITFEIEHAKNEPRIEGYNPVYYKHFVCHNRTA